MATSLPAPDSWEPCGTRHFLGGRECPPALSCWHSGCRPLTGVCHAAQLLPLVLHPLWTQPGPQGHLHPEPTVGPAHAPGGTPGQEEVLWGWLATLGGAAGELPARMHPTLQRAGQRPHGPPAHTKADLTSAISTNTKRWMFWGPPNHSPRSGPVILGMPRAPHAREARRPRAQQLSSPPCPPPAPSAHSRTLLPGHPAWPPPGPSGFPPCPGTPHGPSAFQNSPSALRARGCQPQAPSFFRQSPGALALHQLPEADALDEHLGPGRRPAGPRLLQDH